MRLKNEKQLGTNQLVVVAKLRELFGYVVGCEARSPPLLQERQVLGDKIRVYIENTK